ncbi:hypothetical protein Cgig2_023606 [Carnegiea gigantea]|uniref:Uncharacterized protein n=1 Tax=Carnegiea gigantea TaxID=171969 RepID=A0A9Q1QIE2_9CARY|nr:hypothetical protein Cgig2_023606 [Carnegiea gigantea]
MSRAIDSTYTPFKYSTTYKGQMLDMKDDSNFHIETTRHKTAKKTGYEEANQIWASGWSNLKEGGCDICVVEESRWPRRKLGGGIRVDGAGEEASERARGEEPSLCRRRDEESKRKTWVLTLEMSTSSSEAETLRRNRILSSKLYFDVPPSKAPVIYSPSYDIAFMGFEKFLIEFCVAGWEARFWKVYPYCSCLPTEPRSGLSFVGSVAVAPASAVVAWQCLYFVLESAVGATAVVPSEWLS